MKYLTSLFLLSIVLANVGGSLMYDSMKGFSIWLLYGNTIIYTLGFWILAFLMNDNPLNSKHFSWKYQKHYIVLAISTAMNAFFYQFSVVWIDPLIVLVLGSLVLLQAPLFEWLLIPTKRKNYTFYQILGLLIVYSGMMISMIPVFEKIPTILETSSSYFNKWYWLLCFAISTIFTAWGQSAQYLALTDPKVKISPYSYTAWYNLYTVPLFCLALFVDTLPIINGSLTEKSLSLVLSNQIGAFRCFFGIPFDSDVLSGLCNPGATLWPLVLCIGFIGIFTTNALLIKNHGVLYPNMVAAIVWPLSALLLSPSLYCLIFTLFGFLTTFIGLYIKNYKPSLKLN